MLYHTSKHIFADWNCFIRYFEVPNSLAKAHTFKSVRFDEHHKEVVLRKNYDPFCKRCILRICMNNWKTSSFPMKLRQNWCIWWLTTAEREATQVFQLSRVLRSWHFESIQKMIWGLYFWCHKVSKTPHCDSVKNFVTHFVWRHKYGPLEKERRNSKNDFTEIILRNCISLIKFFTYGHLWASKPLSFFNATAKLSHASSWNQLILKLKDPMLLVRYHLPHLSKQIKRILATFTGCRTRYLKSRGL